MKNIIQPLLRYIFLGLSFNIGSAYVYAQQESIANSVEAILSIPNLPLSVLPKSDCDLNDLEQKYYKIYTEKNISLPKEIEFALEQKRRDIDFRRIYIDSLYYIQALQEINKQNPHWNDVLQNIEKSLLHNRFFVRSILFKLNYLSRQDSNLEACLIYLNESMHTLSSKEKVIQTAENIYGKLLSKVEMLNDKGLYQDALNLILLMSQYFEAEFPLQYIAYREDQAKYHAYQGIFNSYFSVATKAFDQKMYQMAQKYAILSFDYYKKNEKYMSGINPTLELLDKIIQKYSKFTLYSDLDEKNYFQTLIDSIVSHTGLIPTKASTFDPDEVILTDMSQIEEDTKKFKSSTKTSDNTYQSIKKEDNNKKNKDSNNTLAVAPTIAVTRSMTESQAQKLFNSALQAANLNRKQRQFYIAHLALYKADSLRRFYTLKYETDFPNIWAENTISTVDQLLNKAQYRLWNNLKAEADSLYALALMVAEQHKQANTATPNITVLNQTQTLIANYLQQTTELLCQKAVIRLDKAIKNTYQQITYGKYAQAKMQFDEIKSIEESIKINNVGCVIDSNSIFELQGYFLKIQTYEDTKEKANQLLYNQLDTIGYIKTYLEADRIYKESGLSAITASQTSLFNKLSYAREFRILLLWAQFSIVEEHNYEFASFLLGYLKESQYTPNLYEELRKLLKKGKSEI
ncbi:MAG: hypothetical protein RRX93_06000 [Bacteroidales bacterium]